jgi:hypothetical protein
MVKCLIVRLGAAIQDSITSSSKAGDDLAGDGSGLEFVMVRC